MCQLNFYLRNKIRKLIFLKKIFRSDATGEDFSPSEQVNERGRFFFLSLFIYFETERERESALRRGRESGRERESQAGSTVSPEPHGMALSLTNHAIMT